jgi:hypothetical protein
VNPSFNASVPVSAGNIKSNAVSPPAQENTGADGERDSELRIIPVDEPSLDVSSNEWLQPETQYFDSYSAMEEVDSYSLMRDADPENGANKDHWDDLDAGSPDSFRTIEYQWANDCVDDGMRVARVVGMIDDGGLLDLQGAKTFEAGRETCLRILDLGA